MIVMMTDSPLSFFSFTDSLATDFILAAAAFSYLPEKDVGRDLTWPFQAIRRAFFYPCSTCSLKAHREQGYVCVRLAETNINCLQTKILNRKS